MGVHLLRILIAVFWLMLRLASCACAERPDSAARLFEDRILPIHKSEQPSSCSACHFAGVAIRDYIRPTQVETFAALRQAGLIDVEHPEESKLLVFLLRKPDSATEAQEQLRRTEYQAFRDWIVAAVKEPELLQAKSTERIGTELPVEVIRHARSDRVTAAFVENVWSEMARCINCHSPERNRNKIEKFGREYIESISWIVPHDPQATLRKLEETGNIDLEAPAASYMLTKPAGLDEHGGGPKFQSGDVAYQKFLAFLTDYAALRKSQYRTAADLPEERPTVALLTHQHLRITDFPADLGNVLWRVELFQWNHADRQWSEHAVGEVSGRVNVKQHLGQGIAHVFLPRDAEDFDQLRHEPRLPRGPWLAKLYVDQQQVSERNATADWGDEAFVGQFEIRREWQPGVRPPKVVPFPHPSDRD